VSGRIRSLWKRATLRRTRYGDRHRAFRLLYAISDPWQMAAAPETHRFEQTNRIIEEEIGRSRTLLEIGCGEGHQTAHLVKIADAVHGVDVSRIAVTRARAAVPNATFGVADLLNCPRIPGGGKYDLVVACEVLYYLQDVEAAIAALNTLGRRCLVTYFQGEVPRLDVFLLRIPDVRSRLIERDGTTWKVAWWDAALAGLSPNREVSPS
jgi:SAM-dependent methyltransferase